MLKTAHFENLESNALEIFHPLIYNTEASYWNEMVFLGWLDFPSEATTYFLNNFKLLKLQEVRISINNGSPIDVIITLILSVRKLSIGRYDSRIKLKKNVFESLLRHFPTV